jgi:hypothetical protein
MVSTILAVWIGRRKDGSPTSSEPLDDWDIPRLVAYLNEAGLALRMVSARKDGVIDQAAFLTITDQEWEDLDRLFKNPKWISQWRGTLYCKRNTAGYDLSHWGDYSLVAGPFLFFGDPELLARVRDALAPLISSEDRLRSPTK